jgi:phosphoribosylanthranilate isomerase
MSLWIKICGNTSYDDTLLALDAGADAVGFVFAPSPRHVTESEVAGITARLPASIEKIGVFVDSPWETMYEAVRLCGLTGVQLHSQTAPDLPARLHARLGPQLRVLRVVHFAPGASSQAKASAEDPHVDAVLIDSRTETAVGGTGVIFDWTLARETLFQGVDAPKHLVVAGGLTPDNVAEAITTLRPWGVDVVTGVELYPGRKDPLKVRKFVENARAATQNKGVLPSDRSAAKEVQGPAS